MPELPEVETVKTRLRPVLLSQTIKAVQIFHNKSFIGNPQQVINSSIQDVGRKAKILRIKLSNHQNLLIHLKMTGQLIFVDQTTKLGGGHPTADWVKSLPSSHTRVVFSFKSGANLFFNDMRIFGWIKQLSDDKVAQLFKQLGPDAIDDELTALYLKRALRNRTVAIKQAIMNSDIIGGIGNIYASEALFVAGIYPHTPSNKLSKAKLEKLVSAIKQVIHEGIQAGGTTFDGKFVDVHGLAGNYQTQLRVYGKEAGSCPICRHEIKKISTNNRGTYYCPACQH